MTVWCKQPTRLPYTQSNTALAKLDSIKAESPSIPFQLLKLVMQVVTESESVCMMHAENS